MEVPLYLQEKTGSNAEYEKNIDGTANCVDPDQTAPAKGAV